MPALRRERARYGENVIETVEQVRERVAKIESWAEDDERAHNQQDKLYVDVLEAIAAGVPNAAELARARRSRCRTSSSPVGAPRRPTYRPTVPNLTSGEAQRRTAR